MDALTLGYVTGTTILFLFLGIVWSSRTDRNLMFKMIFYINAITGVIILARYFASIV